MKCSLLLSVAALALGLGMAGQSEATNCSYLPSGAKSALNSGHVSKATLKSLRRHNRRCHNLQSFVALSRAWEMSGKPDKARNTLHSAEAILDGGELQRLSAHQALLELNHGDICAASGFYQKAQRSFRKASYQPPVYQNLVRKFEGQRNNGVVSAEQIDCMVKGARALGIVAKVSLQVNFELNSDRINHQGRQQVEQLINAIEKQGGNVRIHLVGHTDTTGDAAYNQNLSERRAASTAQAISRYNPDWRYKIKTSGRGEYEPLSRGNSRSDHAINRRVEVEFK